MSEQWVGLMSILAFDVITGVSPVVTKLISLAVPSFLLVAIRFSFAAVALFIIMVMLGKWNKSTLHVTKKQLFGLILLGMVGSGIASFLNVVAIRQIGAALATILVNLEIPLGILFAVWILHEKVSPRFLVVALYILIGVFLVTAGGNLTIQGGTNFWVGVIASLFAAILWGGCTVVAKVLLGKLSSFAVAFYRFVFAAVFNSLIVFVLYSNEVVPTLHAVTLSDWMKLTYLGFGGSAIALVLYYRALKRMEVKYLSLLVTLPVVISVFLGLATGETFLFHQWIGALFIITGITVVLSRDKRGESLL